MVEDCCKLVGNLALGLSECIISVSTSCNVEIINACVTKLLEGPGTLSINISGYASNTIWKDCPARAGVSVGYVTKYDCDQDVMHIIYVSKGQSYKIGNIENLGVDLLDELPTSCISLSASSSSGPASLYTEAEQVNGYGLNYNGLPITFNTDNEQTLKMDLGNKLGRECYLNSFNIEAQPGQFPVASYSFIKAL